MENHQKSRFFDKISKKIPEKSRNQWFQVDRSVLDLDTQLFQKDILISYRFYFYCLWNRPTTIFLQLVEKHSFSPHFINKIN